MFYLQNLNVSRRNFESNQIFAVTISQTTTEQELKGIISTCVRKPLNQTGADCHTLTETQLLTESETAVRKAQTGGATTKLCSQGDDVIVSQQRPDIMMTENSNKTQGISTSSPRRPTGNDFEAENSFNKCLNSFEQEHKKYGQDC